MGSVAGITVCTQCAVLRGMWSGKVWVVLQVSLCAHSVQC